MDQLAVILRASKQPLEARMVSFNYDTKKAEKLPRVSSKICAGLLVSSLSTCK